MGIQLGGATTPPTSLGGTQSSAPTTGGINLVKGQRIDLTKGNPGLKNVKVGLGWDTNGGSGADFDLDAVAFMLNSNKKIPNDSHFVYYGGMKSPDGAVQLNGDNLTGQGEGDDETITVRLDQVDANVDRIRFGVAIYDANSRNQNFGQVDNAFIRLVNEDTNEEICRYDLTENHSTAIFVEVGDIYRNNGEWKFMPTEISSKDDLGAVLAQYR